MSSVSLEKCYKGDIQTVFDAISATTTSGEIDISGYNAALVSVTITGSGTWKVDVQGKLLSTAAYSDIYDNNDNQLTTGNLTASRIKLFVAVTDFIKLVATEVSGTATCTVRIQPINV